METQGPQQSDQDCTRTSERSASLETDVRSRGPSAGTTAFPSQRSMRRIRIAYLSVEITIALLGSALLVGAFFSKTSSEVIFSGGGALLLIFGIAPEVTQIRRRRCTRFLEISPSEINIRNPRLSDSVFTSLPASRIVRFRVMGRSVALELSDKTTLSIDLSTLCSTDRRDVARALVSSVPSTSPLVNANTD